MTEPTEPPTILIVDDEPYNVDYLRQTLGDLGYRTREAYGGKEALDAVGDSPPDLILLDVMMPDVDGITVCRILKGDPATRFIPIVIMTALDGKEDRIRGIEAGADDFLTKPVDDRELLARINAAIRTKQAVDDTVRELASAAEQLNSMGMRVDEMAVLAVELRPAASPQGMPPSGAYDYLVSRYASMTKAVLEQTGANVVESSGDQLLAVLPNRELGRAIEAAFAIRSEIDQLNHSNEVQPLAPAIAIHSGEVSMQARRVSQDGAGRWVYAAGGEVRDEVLTMVAAAGDGEVFASGAVVDAVETSYVTEPVEVSGAALIRAHRIVGPAVEHKSEKSVHAAPGADQVRMLATIFVSDLVGSTALASQLGDRAWTGVLEGHYRLVRETFARHNGEEISTAGDGFLALFDRPAEAIRAALSISDQSAAEGLPIRVGIHTGEIERTVDDVQGINVHLASRVSAEARSGEVLVSSTTRDAVAGSELRFEDRGLRELKGIDEPRRVFLVLPG